MGPSPSPSARLAGALRVPAATDPGGARAPGALPATATWQHRQPSTCRRLPGLGCRRDGARGPREAGAGSERLPSDASASPPEGIRGIAVAAGGPGKPVPGILVQSLAPVAAAQHASARPTRRWGRAAPHGGKAPSPARLKESCWSRTASSPSRTVATAGLASSPAPHPGAAAEGLYLFRSSCLCS